MTLYQEKFQDIQEFRDQYMAIRISYHGLGSTLGRWEDYRKAVKKKA